MTSSPDMIATARRAYGDGQVRNVYDFRCPACGSCGEIAIDVRQVDVHCPEYDEGVKGTCTARFVQYRVLGQLPKMALRCVNEQEARFQVLADTAHRRPLRFTRSC